MSVVTVSQAAARLGVKPQTLYAYVSRGALTGQRAADGRTTLLDADEVEALARRGRPRRSSRSPALDIIIETKITSVDRGTLSYRGHDAVDLARTHTFEEVAHLVWTGSLPERFASWPPAGAPSLGVSRDVLDHLSVFDRFRVIVALADRGHRDVPAAGRSIIAGVVDAFADSGDGRRARLYLTERPPLAGTIAARLTPALSPSARVDRAIVEAVNASLVLLTDHELASSTLAVRVAASTRADPAAAIGAGLGALSGPLHGSASGTVRSIFDAVQRGTPVSAAIDAVSTQVASGHGVSPVVAVGFGHPLYPDGDPRGAALLLRARAVAASHRRSHEMWVIDQVAEVMGAQTGRAPNVDFGLAALGHVAQMRPDAGQIIFTVARMAGWLGHAIEEYEQEPLRFRGRARYIG
ncbi:MAG: citrate synthase [Acidimicrobiia bacterium]